MRGILDIINDPWITFETSDGYDDDNTDIILTITKGHVIGFVMLVMFIINLS